MEQFLIKRLKLTRQLAEFLPDNFSKEEQEIVEILKQLADYNISAQTIRKIENTLKTGSDIVYTHQLMTYIPLTVPVPFKLLNLNGINNPG